MLPTVPCSNCGAAPEKPADRCPSCGGQYFIFWRSEPSEIDLSDNTVSESGCESQTEISCRACGYEVDVNEDFDLHGAIMRVADCEAENH